MLDFMEKAWKIINKYPLLLYRIEASYVNYPTYISDELYNVLQETEKLAYPTKENDYIRGYRYFMLPVKVKSEVKFVPIGLYYLKKFDIYQLEILTKGILEVKREGNEKETHYPPNHAKLTRDVISLIYRVYEFAKVQREKPIYIGLHNLYKRYLTGTVKLKYVMEPKISKEEAKQVLKAYRENLKNKLQGDVSLRQYLGVVKVIYETLGYKVDGDLKELYKAHADFRDCGMMKLPLDDVMAFKKWLREEALCGGHPFEVIAGGLTTYGISLYPPEDGRYLLSPGDMIEEFYLVVKEFLKRKIPFYAPRLVEVLKILTGEAKVRVNEENYFPRMIVYYDEVKRKDKIEWDDIEEVEYLSIP